MSKVVPFPGHRKLPAASPIPREEFERLAELALDIVDCIVAILDEGDGDPDREDGGDAEPRRSRGAGLAGNLVQRRGSRPRGGLHAMRVTHAADQ